MVYKYKNNTIIDGHLNGGLAKYKSMHFFVSRHYARISALARLKFLDNDNHIFDKSSIIIMNI